MKNRESTLTKIDGMFTEIRDFEKKIELKKSSMVKKIVKELRKLIESSDGIEAIRWTQYTPHFMDGEPCYFRVNELQFKFTSDIVPSPSDNESDQYYASWQIRKLFRDIKDIVNHERIDELEAMTLAINEIQHNLWNLAPSLKECFGDHAMIVLTKSGLDITRYNHD